MQRRMKVALFGLGVWGCRYWLGPLLEMTEEGLTALQLVDLSANAPSWLHPTVDGVLEIRMCDVESRPTETSLDLCFHISGAHLQYVPSENREALKELEAAIVVTGARDHLPTIQSILASCRKLRILICEKPCGDSMAEFAEIQSLCEAADVQLVVSDHYLLRPGLREFLGDPDSTSILHAASSIRAFMLESTSDGPPDQDASLDMLVHPLNLLHTLFPESSPVAKKVCMGQGVRNPHASITYCSVRGVLRSRHTDIPCYIEVGKQLFDQKEMVIETPTTSHAIDLRKGSAWTDGVWAYRGLLDAVLSHSVSGNALRSHGGIPAASMLTVWEEMETIREHAPATKMYQPGQRPACE